MQRNIQNFFLIWGFFGYSKTGVFPVGAKVSSDNQLALSITLNKIKMAIDSKDLEKI